MTSIPLLVSEEDVENGGKDFLEDDFAYRNNVHQASTKIRLAFLRKVYSLLFIQLLVTTITGFTVMCFSEVRIFVQNNDWLLSLGFLSSIFILIALHIKRKETPVNFILLGLFTIVQAYTVGVVVSFFDKFLVIQALFLTVAVLAGLTAFTFQTKRDFSNLKVVLFCALIILFVGGILQMIFQNNVFELVISLSGAFIFSLFIIYDTQNLMLRVSPEEYILATIELYLDIINLFLYILRALGAARRA